jgi:hypothetical protein
MNREQLTEDINSNVYTNTTGRIKGNTVRDRLRNLVTWLLSWEDDVVTTLSGADDDHIPTAKTVADAIGDIPTPSLQEVTTEDRITTDGIVVRDTGVSDTDYNAGQITHQDTDNNKDVSLIFDAPTGVGGQVHIPDVAGATKTIAFAEDVSAQSLQDVTDEGNETTNAVVSKSGNRKAMLNATEAIALNTDNDTFAVVRDDGSVGINTNGSNTLDIKNTDAIADITLEAPAKSAGSYTIATTDDIPTVNEHFKGKYTSLSALNTAVPTAADGDYAIVDAGTGHDAVEYIWDAQEGWVAGASTGASTTDALPEGSTNLYFTNSRALSAAPAETASTVGALITAASSPSLSDSHLVAGASSNVLKQWSWTAIKAFLKTYFDGQYQSSLGYTAENTSNKDTDGTLAANSDTKYPSQKAVKTYVDNAVTGLLEFKSATDCSANPNYPSANKGDSYVVSVAGKIGGASGKSVDVGDVYVAIADNAGGTEASVGTSWIVLEHNLQGALLASNNLSDVANAATARTNLGLGSAAVLASSAVAQTANNLSDLANAATARTNLGFDDKYAVLAETTTDGTISSGTSNTYSSGVLITPDMVAAGMTIEVSARCRKTSTNGTWTIRLYANTTNDLSGSPVLLGVLSSIGSTQLVQAFWRSLAIKVKASNTEVFPTGSSSVNENGSSTSAVTTAVVDWTTNQYLIIATQTANGGDAARCSFLHVRR